MILNNLGFWLIIKKRGFQSKGVEMFMGMDMRLGCIKLVDFGKQVVFGRKWGVALKCFKWLFCINHGIGSIKVKLVRCVC